VDTASTAKKGLTLNSTLPYEIVIVSHRLADMSAIDLCRKLLLECPELAIVIIAGADDQAMVSNALDLGVSQYVIKDDQSAYLELLPGIVTNLLRRVAENEALQAAEASHRDNEDRHNMAAVISRIGYWSWDHGANRLSSCSPGLADIFGVSEAEYVERRSAPDHDSDWYHLDDRQNHCKTVETARKNNTGYNIISRIINGRGEIRWIHEICVVTFNGGGQLKETFGAVQDVTQVKQTEEELQKVRDDLEYRVEQRAKELSEIRGRFDTLADDSPIGIFYCGTDGIAEYVNESVAVVTGYPIRELVGNPWHPKIHPMDRDAITERWMESVKMAEPWHSEFRFLKPDGAVSWVVGRSTPQIDTEGNVIGHVGMLLDITDRKRVEQELRETRDELELRVADRTRELIESENSFRDYSEVSSDWFWALDENLCYTSILPAATGEAEFPVSDYLGRPRSEFKPDGINDTAWQAHMEDLEEHRAFRNFIQPRPLKDGSVIWLSVSGKPVFDEQRKFIGYRGTANDITEQNKTEDKLRRQHIITEKAEQAANYGHWMWDEVNDICLHCSEGLAHLRGMTVDEYMSLMASPDSDTKRIKSEYRARVHEAWKDLRNNKGHYSIEYQFVHTNGEARWVREIGSPMDVSDTGKVLTSVGITYDITDAREIENRLRESEERYRQIADISSDWVWEMDAELRFTYFSEGFERITGINQSFAIGKTRQEVAAPSMLDLPRWQEHLADLEAHREFRDFEYASIEPDGEQHYFWINGSPVFDQKNKFMGYRGTATDVTKRISTQEALAGSTAKLGHAVALAKLGHYVWDGVKKRAISCTEEYARIHGVSVDEYLAITDSIEALFIWIHPDDRDHYRDSIEQAMARRSDLELEYRIITRDGQVRYVHEIFDPTYDDQGRLIQTRGAMQDITERKRVEEALKDAERLASLGNWCWSVDQNRIVSYSEGLVRVLGISRDDASASMAVPGFGLIHAEDRERHAQIFKNAIKKGLNYEIEYRIIRTDGEVRDIQEIAESIEGPNGKCHELKGTIQDITERKNVERELEEAKTQAEQANQAKSSFLSSMSHELRTPLNAILGFSQILESSQKNPLTAAQQSSVEQITRGGYHLLELITQVLDFARIETGQTQLTTESFDIDNAILECLSITEALAESHNIKIIDNASGKGLPPILADFTRVKQVLINLLSNGVKYNREGGTLTVDAELTNEKMMRISITDTGFGISDELHHQVFEAFDRLGRESLDVEGTGIGLTISKQLVELMNGRIRFSSKIGKGSSFWIELPLADVNEVTEIACSGNGEALEPGQLTGKDHRKQRVLYIEDNFTNAQLMSLIFEGMTNIELTVSVDAESGLKVARKDPPDLILMDIQLPGMDGIEATAKLKKSTKTRKIPVIAVSAAAMTADLERAREVGFYDYLTKPIDIGKTLEIVSHALQENA
jgi:PAS domain S-box-containing protein